ncbi:unnamed protein product [Rhizopus stolonifer]
MVLEKRQNIYKTLKFVLHATIETMSTPYSPQTSVSTPISFGDANEFQPQNFMDNGIF